MKKAEGLLTDSASDGLWGTNGKLIKREQPGPILRLAAKFGREYFRDGLPANDLKLLEWISTPIDGRYRVKQDLAKVFGEDMEDQFRRLVKRMRKIIKENGVK